MMNVFSAAPAKLGLFPAHVDDWLRTGRSQPITVEIHPTERCNHHCPGCQAQYSMPVRDVRSRAARGVDMDFEVLRSVWAHAPEGVVISGNTGDPLLHPDLGRLLSELKRRAIPTVLITNGEALTPDLTRRALETCRGIRISLDAADAAGFSRTHGCRADAWERVLEAVRLLVRTRHQLALSADECLVGVGFLTGERTRASMVDAARLAHDLNVDYIQFRPFHWDTTDVTAEIELARTTEGPTFRVLSSDQKYDRLYDRARRYTRCHGAHFFSVIDARGDVYLCCHHVGNPDARIGSVRETEWREILASPQRAQVLGQFDVSTCVPLCRLHAHNEALEAYLRGGGLPDVASSAVVRRHGAFL